MLKKIHKEYEFESKKKHLCKELFGNRNFSIEYTEKYGWVFIDESVKVKGTDSSYATGIGYCPYCGEKL